MKNVKLNKSSLFLTELVIDLFVFIICAIVCSVLLVRAYTINIQSETLVEVTHYAQKLVEEWKGEANADALLKNANENLNKIGKHTQNLKITTNETENEGVISLKIKILNARGENIYELDVKKIKEIT